MTDRKKVITGVDICLSRFHCGKDCPYYNAENRSGCMELLRKDALELLKEQKPQKAIRKHHRIENESGSVTILAEYYCQSCNKMIAKGYSPHYPRCMWCGQAVKWDD